MNKESAYLPDFHVVNFHQNVFNPKTKKKTNLKKLTKTRPSPKKNKTTNKQKNHEQVAVLKAEKPIK